jgi:hypothetical protein
MDTKTSSRFGRYIRKVATGATLATALGLGVSVLAAPPASAATSVGYCFFYTDGSPAAGIYTQVSRLLANGNWERIGYGRTGSTGCDIRDTRAFANNYIKVFAGSGQEWGVRIIGSTRNIAYPGYHHANLGWDYVTILRNF